MKKEDKGQGKVKVSASDDELLAQYPDIYYITSTGKFVVPKKEDGGYLVVNRTTFMDLLLGDPNLGLLEKVPYSQKECKPIIAVIVRKRSVDIVCNIAGYKRGVHDLSGVKVLVPQGYTPPPIRKGEFGFLHAFFSWMAPENRDASLSWLKMAVDKIHNSKKRHLQALHLIGPAGTGKSLLLAVIKGCIGASANPYEAFAGKTEFNSEILTSPLLLMDDMPNIEKHRYSQFYNNMKHVIMADEKRCRFLYQDGFTVSPIQAIAVSMNTSNGNWMSLPTYENAMRDKFMVLLLDKCYTKLPGFEHLNDKDVIAEQLVKEMPGFLYWLIHEYEIPEHLLPKCAAEQRYGLHSFWNEEVIEHCSETSQADKLLEVIDAYMEANSRDQWNFMAENLRQVIQFRPNKEDYKDFLSSTRVIGQQLRELAQERPTRIKRGRRKESGYEWVAFAK